MYEISNGMYYFSTIPKDEITDWLYEADYLFDLNEVHYDDQYKLIDKNLVH